jgi:hypothetical protein
MVLNTLFNKKTKKIKKIKEQIITKNSRHLNQLSIIIRLRINNHHPDRLENSTQRKLIYFIIKI